MPLKVVKRHNSPNWYLRGTVAASLWTRLQAHANDKPPKNSTSRGKRRSSNVIFMEAAKR